MADERPIEAEVVNPETGEIIGGVPATMAVHTPADPFYGISTVEIRKEEADMLLGEFPPEKIDILPTGEVYLTQVEYRRLLNVVFGPGAWGLRRMTAPEEIGGTIMVMYALVVRGAVVAEAPGECDYQPSNPRQSKATALESAKSNALMRCCKDLGIASQCWDKRWAEAFKDQFCVMVRCQGSNKPHWRRKDSKPFWNETGPWNAQGGRQSDERPPSGQRRGQTRQEAPAASGAASDPRRKVMEEVVALAEQYAKAVKISTDEAVQEFSGFTPAGKTERYEVKTVNGLANTQAVSLKWLHAMRRRGEELLKEATTVRQPGGLSEYTGDGPDPGAVDPELDGIFPPEPGEEG